MDYEILLFDRLEILKSMNSKYDLENNAYISFSGGKDSTILHHLIDLALPNNRIPRVFINTGIEYVDIVNYVKELASKDDRFVIVKPSKNIKETLEKYGYPFKSKMPSKKVSIYKNNGLTEYIKQYLEGIKKDGSKSNYVCPKILYYQFTEEFNKFKISNLCCDKLKKEPAKKWAKKNHRTILITGMRKEEGGARQTNISCVITDKNNKAVKLHPLVVVSEEWENEFVERNNIKLCQLYYPPYNFKRTGCKGCPFALELQDQLSIMEKLLPNEYKQCELIWKPVYEEYRRLNYRLTKDRQLTIDDFL